MFRLTQSIRIDHFNVESILKKKGSFTFFNTKSPKSFVSVTQVGQLNLDQSHFKCSRAPRTALCRSGALLSASFLTCPGSGSHSPLPLSIPSPRVASLHPLDLPLGLRRGRGTWEECSKSTFEILSDTGLWAACLLAFLPYVFVSMLD